MKISKEPWKVPNARNLEYLYRKVAGQKRP